MLISLSPTCISILLSPSEAAECVCTTVFLRPCEGISFILHKNAHSVQLASFCQFRSREWRGSRMGKRIPPLVPEQSSERGVCYLQLPPTIGYCWCYQSLWYFQRSENDILFWHRIYPLAFILWIACTFPHCKYCWYNEGMISFSWDLQPFIENSHKFACEIFRIGGALYAAVGKMGWAWTVHGRMVSKALSVQQP